jgi:hypothetical protein
LYLCIKLSPCLLAGNDFHQRPSECFDFDIFTADDRKNTSVTSENNDSQLCVAHAETYANFSVAYLDFGTDSQNVLQIDPLTKGGTLSYRQMLPTIGNVGEIFLSVPRLSFPIPGLHWNIGTVQVSGFGRSASFTFGFHVRQPRVKTIFPSSGKAGTRITCVLMNIFSAEIGTLDIPFLGESRFSAQIANYVVETTHIEMEDGLDSSASLSLIVPDLGYNSDTTVLVIIWSPVLGTAAMTHFRYRVMNQPSDMPTFSIQAAVTTNESQPDRQDDAFNHDNLKNITTDGGEETTYHPIYTMAPCVASRFCSARGLAANPKQNSEMSLCNAELMCLPPSTVSALVHRPLGVRPNRIVDGMTVVTATFTNCFATAVGQVKITRISGDAYTYSESLPVPILGLITRPGLYGGEDPSSPWECEISFQTLPSFQPLPPSKNVSCQDQKFRFTVNLGATTQSTDFVLQNVGRFTNQAKIEHPSKLYWGASDAVIIRLSHAAVYKLPQVIIYIPEVTNHVVSIVVGDCQDLLITVQVDLTDVDIISHQLNISVVAIYNQNEENDAAVENISLPELVARVNNSSDVFTTENKLELPIFLRPSLALQHPSSIPSASGGIMLFQVLSRRNFATFNCIFLNH